MQEIEKKGLSQYFKSSVREVHDFIDLDGCFLFYTQREINQ